MLLRDLLVAMPGLIGSTSSASRAEDIEAQRPSQIALPASTLGTAKTGSIQGISGSSPFMDQALEDFHQQVGVQFADANLPVAGPGGNDPVPPSAPEEDQDGIEDPDIGAGPGTGHENTVPVGTPIALDNGKMANVMAGRVATLLPDDDRGPIESIRILKEAEWGHVSVNPDNSLAVVLSGTDKQGTLSFSYEVNYANGYSETVTTQLNVTAGQQKAGWGVGDHYMLETDDQGNSIVEHGDIHRKVYVSADSDALSINDIAKMEGVKASAINGTWLAAHSEYGSSAEMALDEAAGMALWKSLTGTKAGPSSHWLLLESGHTYDSTKFLVNRGTQGESALNPVLISSYGEGAKPIITDQQVYNGTQNANIVIRGLTFTGGLDVLQGSNYLVEDVSIRRETIAVQKVDGFTLRNSDIIDVYRSKSVTDDFWQPHINRTSGFYANDIKGLLIENNLVDHAGWADNYRMNLALSGGQPPSMYSHGMYLNYDNSDLTLRDNILMRGASFGAQVRSGGVIENNLFLDNNAGVNFLGGSDNKAFGAGNYTLFTNNVVTSGAHRDVTEGPRGALTMGADNSGRMTAMIGNIITHLADPNNASEMKQKYWAHPALKEKFAPLYDDTIIYNWIGSRNAGKPDENEKGIGSLDRGTLDETTIQKFTADLLNKPNATIADLATHLRAQADGKLDGQVDSDVINAFFRTGFGLDTTLRGQAETLRFVPNDLADGIRWDNRLNWSTGDLPGTRDGDSVDLGGNHVIFTGQTASVDHFDFGDGGRLTAMSGKLTITDEANAGPRGGAFETDGTGQIWVGGYQDKALLEIEVSGGRFVNSGTMAGYLDVSVANTGQAVLAGSDARMVLNADSSLTLQGSKAKVGFDGSGNGMSVLQLEQDTQLGFVADAKGFSKIAEFRSGAFGDAPAVQSGIALDGKLTIDIEDLGKLDPKQDSRWMLLQADEIIGQFDSLAVEGLGRRQDALLRIDYDQDTVTFVLGAEGRGSGRVRIVAEGDEDFQVSGNDALANLWDEMHMSF